MLSKGDEVLLQCPDNPRLDGSACTVKEVTEWGAHLKCPAAATGQYRATFDEMIPIQATNGKHKEQVKRTVETMTGDMCKICGGFQLVRTGSCVTCQDCGNNEGCG